MPLSGNLLVNGIHWPSRKPLADPIAVSAFVSELAKSLRARKEIAQHAQKVKLFQARRPTYHSVDPSDPVAAGWALLVHESDQGRLQGLFADLIKRRHGTVLAAAAGETEGAFLDRWRGLPSQPQYVLMAAPPDRLSFKLQNYLNCYTGRLWFDTTQEFERYLGGLLEAEDNDAALPAAHSVFLATDQDDVTSLSRQLLAEPLAALVRGEQLTVSMVDGGNATVENLATELAKRQEGRGAALLFTASHGAAFDKGTADQRACQGSLVCDDGLFSAACITGDVCLRAGMAFFFACYSAGTPARSEFSLWYPSRKQDLERAEAATDFLAALPVKLLGGERPALAVVAHLDPAWMHSFVDVKNWCDRRGPFQEALTALLQGAPIGHAMRLFSKLCAGYNSYLLDLQVSYEQARLLNQPNPALDSNLFDTWILRTDSQNYMILGDPAARLHMA